MLWKNQDWETLKISNYGPSPEVSIPGVISLFGWMPVWMESIGSLERTTTRSPVGILQGCTVAGFFRLCQALPQYQRNADHGLSPKVQKKTCFSWKSLMDLNLGGLNLIFKVNEDGERLVEMNVRGESEVDGKE